MVVACTKNAVVMVEGQVDSLSEDEVLAAIFYVHEQVQPLIDMQEDLQASCGKQKREVAPPVIDEELYAKVKELAAGDMAVVVGTADKIERGNRYDVLKNKIVAELDESGERGGEIKDLLSSYKKAFMRNKIVDDEMRIDGRTFDQVRPISCEVGYLPRAHGSALFTRGETQALVTATLGSERDQQRVETLGGEENNRFMLHYNFPPFCVGEVRRLSGPSRRRYRPWDFSLARAFRRIAY